MKNFKLLVVDDTPVLLEMVKDFLEEEGYAVKTAISGQEALQAIEEDKPDAVIMDIKMPGMSGLDALSEIKKKDPQATVIMMTAYGTTQTAIEAMKRGAYDYITKPFKNEEVKALIKKALEAGRLMKEKVFLRTDPDNLDGVCIIGKSSPMLDIYKTIGKVAESNATVSIRGESGTGKELVARAIFQNSLRRDKPFLAVNCAAIPESLLESELFGHARGSFTGAINKRVGKFQQCEGGTIFLDEIGDMSLSTQAKILRVLQEHTFQPVGSEETSEVDVRVITSTNKDLWRAIEAGQFREDLYYRLKVVTLYMPPLRQRKEDIPLLVDYFLQKFNREFNKSIKNIHPDAMSFLSGYDWPGNVRELENAIQTAVVMAKKEILFLEDFPVLLGKPKESVPAPVPALGEGAADNYADKFKELLAPIIKEPSIFLDSGLYKKMAGSLEKTLLETVLNLNNKNQVQSAKVMGISRNTLRALMKEHGLE
ncbi:MAG: sigma-54 dependent transcriptional regulator [Candidatus Omnitrophica bacterium]|nr:sigma-54 dependent transcriptional regulator [Candidatus Omnitrophota bacterium]